MLENNWFRMAQSFTRCSSGICRLGFGKEQTNLANEAQQIRDQISSLTNDRLKDATSASLRRSLPSRRTECESELGCSTGIDQHRRSSIGYADRAASTRTTFSARRVDCTDSPRPNRRGANSRGTCLSARPALCELAVAAARERSRLSRWLWLRLDGVLDVRDGRGYTHTGSGLRFDVPLFNRNQGGILRADWELNGAMHNRDAISDQIIADVRTAYRQLDQAYKNLTILKQDVEPALVESLQIAKKGFEDGGSDYLIVLQTTTQYLTAKGQILAQTAACNRAVAELETQRWPKLDRPSTCCCRVIAATSPPADGDQESSRPGL